MITLIQIQERLIAAMKEMRLSQTELARRLRLTQSSIAHYIKGDISPSLETFANLCKILDIDPSYILCLTN